MQKIRFTPNSPSDFYPVLKKRVDAYFAENNLSKSAGSKMKFKAAALISLYVIPFIVLLFVALPFYAQLGLWIMMGLGVAGIGMSVMHDCNHGSFSSDKRVNFWLGSSLNLCGGSVYNWKLQHNVLHHTYTNIHGMDDDIKERLVLRFNPHSPLHWFHKVQFIYAFFFYGLLTLYWVVAKDFIQYNEYIKRGVNRDSKPERHLALFKIILMKVIYLLVIIGAPILIGNMSVGATIIGFLTMHFVAGNILTFVFQLAHTIKETDHPLANENQVIENEWARHQVETTVNFSPGRHLLTWYVGGLNYQIEHHLFPTIAHEHYPAIAPIVEATAKEYGVRYNVHPTLFTALRSHLQYMHQLGWKQGLLHAEIG